MKIKTIHILFILFVLTNGLSAQLKLWDGGAGTSNWVDANNWNTNSVPVAGDSVVLNHSLISSDYTVTLPNSLVDVKCLSIYPSSPADSIFVTIPATNTVVPNLRVSGIGYNALRIGDRGRFNNNANTFGAVIKFDDLFNYGLLLDVGGYYYHGSISSDTTLIRKLTALTNSTFEFDRPSGSYQNLVFPVNSLVGKVTFYNLIFSGKKAGSMGYGGTLANNWDLIINGDLTIRDGASFGVVRGAVGQTRYVRFRGNINIINTSNTLWFEATASASFGWYTVFEGTSNQTISGNITFLDSIIINNAAGVSTAYNFDVKSGFQSINPLLKLKTGLLNTTGSGIVRILLTGTNTIVGHSTNSYINGKLRRNITGTGSYDFPVGTASNYELANITSTSVTGVSNITAEFLTTNLGNIPTTLTEASYSYDNLLDAGYWRITPNAAITAGNYSVTLNERGYSIGAAPYYTIVKRINELNPWALQGSFVGFNATGGTVTAQRNSFTSFSDFAIAYPLIILPIELVSFDVYKNNTNATIEWQTANEINNDYFTIERSKNALDFEEVKKMKGAGNSNKITKYVFEDKNPYHGMSYYRLKQTNIDHSYKYSEIKALDFSALNNNYNVYPNPSNGQINISVSSIEENKNILLELYNINGLKIHDESFTPSIVKNTHTINLSENLPSGIYLLKIYSGKDIFTQKIIIQ